MKNAKKILIYADAELASWLDAESKRTGAPITELGRRALQAFRYTTCGQPEEKEVTLEGTSIS
jgi:hypothetical protein